jgi:hypothetical protein
LNIVLPFRCQTHGYAASDHIRAGPAGTYASFVIATIIPITTTVTIAICSQIQVEGIVATPYCVANAALP